MNLNEYLKTRPVDSKEFQKEMKKQVAFIQSFKMRELRKAIGLTQEELAKKAGVSQNQISKFENGDIDKAQIGTVKKYAKALGMDLVLACDTGEELISLV
ncbi:MAG: helix-turn-helix transcriptional regulator [Eubacteriales bacterium]|nr:helix-turn-helix transcriptional regulator [Eubacteriales bacterium]